MGAAGHIAAAHGSGPCAEPLLPYPISPGQALAAAGHVLAAAVAFWAADAAMSLLCQLPGAPGCREGAGDTWAWSGRSSSRQGMGKGLRGCHGV